MVEDAESHSEEDKERRQKVDAHNRLDQLIYTPRRPSKSTRTNSLPRRKATSSELWKRPSRPSSPTIFRLSKVRSPS